MHFFFFSISSTILLPWIPTWAESHYIWSGLGPTVPVMLQMSQYILLWTAVFYPPVSTKDGKEFCSINWFLVWKPPSIPLFLLPHIHCKSCSPCRGISRAICVNECKGPADSWSHFLLQYCNLNCLFCRGVSKTKLFCFPCLFPVFLFETFSWKILFVCSYFNPLVQSELCSPQGWYRSSPLQTLNALAYNISSLANNVGTAELYARHP